MDNSRNELIELATNHKEPTLQNIKSGRVYKDKNWHKWEYQLTDQDIIEICEALGGHEKTQHKIANNLRSLSTLPKHWCYERISFSQHTHKWEYTAGQDHTTETAQLRRFFISI
jgi:hypothetical protein